MEDPQPVELKIERTLALELPPVNVEDGKSSKSAVENIENTDSKKVDLKVDPKVEKQPDQFQDNLPENSLKENVEDLKSSPEPQSPITNINQKFQDAMSSFFGRFKKS